MSLIGFSTSHSVQGDKVPAQPTCPPAAAGGRSSGWLTGLPPTLSAKARATQLGLACDSQKAKGSRRFNPSHDHHESEAKRSRPPLSQCL